MENQFRIGGVYRTKGGCVVSLTADVWVDHREALLCEFPDHEFAQAVLAGTQNQWKGYVSLSDGQQVRTKRGLGSEGLDLIPGELHNVGGEWVPISAPNDEGWIEWKGGECPVAIGTELMVRLRNGVQGSHTHRERSLIEWVHRPCGADVLAFRVIEPAKAEPTLLDKIAAGEFNTDFGADGSTKYERANAAMIARDGPTREREPKTEPKSKDKPKTVHSALVALSITRDLSVQVRPGFGSALLG